MAMQKVRSCLDSGRRVRTCQRRRSMGRTIYAAAFSRCKLFSKFGFLYIWRAPSRMVGLNRPEWGVGLRPLYSPRYRN